MRTTPRSGRWRGLGFDAPPRRLRVALREAILLVAVLLAFTRLHAAVATDRAVATENARTLQPWNARCTWTSSSRPTGGWPGTRCSARAPCSSTGCATPCCSAS